MRIVQVSLIAAVVLAGCVNMEQVKADAIQSAKDKCTSHGKQFVLTSVEQTTSRSASEMVTVSGYCVGPGDPGYVNPEH